MMAALPNSGSRVKWGWTTGVPSVLLTLIAAELIFRSLIFSSLPFMAPWKHPDLYASNLTSDYFKLQHLFGIERCAEASDHTIGWVNRRLFEGPDYRHAEAESLGSRTPVLLYGDSFAQCLTSREECFQAILNTDPDFGASHYLLNYGVEGYGVDQIYLLYERTINLFNSPVVVVSILDRDLERAVSASTWGIKPYFTVCGGLLQLHTEHLGTGLEEFFKSNPPEVRSYLFRLVKYNRLIPEPVASWLRGTEQERARIKEVNREIILKFASDLRKRGIKHVFLVFEHAKTIVSPPDWRLVFLVDMFRENGIPFMLTRDAVIQKEGSQDFDWQRYCLNKRSTHPNYLYNRLVASMIRDWVTHGQSRTAVSKP